MLQSLTPSPGGVKKPVLDPASSEMSMRAIRPGPFRQRLPGAWVAALCLLFGSAAADVDGRPAGAEFRPVEAADGGPVPSPALAPDEVVRIQIEALRANDADDRGIAIAFRFASPANKRSTGPLPRFIHMIKAGPYRLMLEYDHASYGEVQVRGDRAAQRVTLTGRGRVRSYVFLLERQAQPPCMGCWMTEAVMVVPGPERSV